MLELGDALAGERHLRMIIIGQCYQKRLKILSYRATPCIRAASYLKLYKS